MVQSIIMPKTEMSMEEGTVVQWLEKGWGQGLTG
jgi:pyruvate/2-oxoglutarate dehydrogenase complex dihydrolipoamide acyltransferase (E2) component